MNNYAGTYLLRRYKSKMFLGVAHLKNIDQLQQKIYHISQTASNFRLGVRELSTDFPSFFDRSGLKYEEVLSQCLECLTMSIPHT